ncbi:MAG: penicillin-binding transpeptidase domain-containing protein [Anaerolineaceae bacterium]
MADLTQKMKKLFFSLLITILLVTGCNLNGGGKTLQPPGVTVKSRPDPQIVGENYLKYWQDDNYSGMYALLTEISQDAITAEEFEKVYHDAVVSLTLKNLDYTVLSVLRDPNNSQVQYKVTFHTNLLGEIEREMTMNLSMENNTWRVQWDQALILPELHGGNKLSLVYDIPSRGNIYDKKGNTLVAQTDAYSVGVMSDQIVPEQENGLLDQLYKLIGISTENLRTLIYNSQPGYVAIGEAPKEEVDKRSSVLLGFGGMVLREFSARYYYDGGIAPQSIGYVLSIPQDRLDEYQRNGYQGNEKIGDVGLERWGEPYLAGEHGATLYVMDANGQPITRIAEKNRSPSQSITTTIDKDLQDKIQKSFGNYRGAAVVLERDTGRILAIVSAPGFDPNIFEPTNYNNVLLTNILNDPELPLYNRAAQGVYPLGSVFKIITMSAALESGAFTVDSEYDCQYFFTELDGFTGEDWTYAKEKPPSGMLTLPQGLMRSCNTYFYHIGYYLYETLGYTGDVADMARGFGLGSPTGIVELTEDPGSIPDATSAYDAVQMAIGQGAMLVTPLQVARFVAAVGNGGTLYRPQLVEKITTIDNIESLVFTPETQGTLPVKAETLKAVQDAMKSVIYDKRGTAYYVLANLPYKLAGKTGTATTPTGGGNSHAWFAGYTDENRPNQPDIAVVVLIENGGEGSEMAAPLFRRIVQLYFSDNKNPGRSMPWEASPYVIASPTPLVTDTLVP